MKKKMSARARIATLAVSGMVAALASGLAMTSSAQAQAWFELRTFPGPRYYDEAPPPFFDEAPPRYYRDAPPRYREGARASDFLPRGTVRRIVERRGYDVIGPIRLTGEVYIVPVEDRRGRVARLVVDARDGEIIDRSGLGGPPRPPAGIGRYNDRFATAPEPLPPLPFDPRGGWNEYDYDGPVPPPPPRKPADRKAGERAKQKPAPKQQAARTPPSAKPDTVKPQAVKPEVAKPATSKPEAAKPDTAKPETARPEAAEPEAAKRDVGEPAEAAARMGPTPPVKPTAPTAPEGAKATDEASASGERKAAPKDAKQPGAESRNASILRRPAQKGEDGDSAERGNVAEGPAVSTGAEPQRKAPRVVYPGPGATTTEPTPATSGE